MPAATRLAVVSLCLAAPLLGADKEKGRSLSLRAVPRVAPAPAHVLFTAELEGGADADVYCPILDWDWGDGSKTSQGGDCPAFAPGETPVERLFEAEHEYRRQSRPTVRLRLTKDGKVLATATVNLVVGAPYRKPSFEVQEN